MQHFIAIATFQAVANLPPLLELMRPGDQLTWLVTDQARERGVVNAPGEVLRERGLPEGEQQSLSNLAALKSALADSGRPIVIGNGGTKVMLLQVWDALSDLNPVLAYGRDRPVQLARYPEGLSQAPEILNYQHDPITLDETLLTSGYRCLEARPIWPQHPSFEQPDYGFNAEQTAHCHDVVFRYFSARTEALKHLQLGGDKRSLPNWQETKRLVDEPFQHFLSKQMRQLSNYLMGQGGRRLRLFKSRAQYDEQQAVEEMGGFLEQYYNAATRLSETAAIQRTTEGQESPPFLIGEALEQAAAYRLHALIEQRPEWHAVLSGCWANTKVATVENPAKVEAEFDIIMLLRNGVLLALECKSADISEKDIDARTYNLRKAGSNLARFSIVAPVYTAYTDRSWFEQQADIMDRFRNFIPFTLPGQPDKFTTKTGETASVSSFEEGIERLISSYLPR